MTAALIGSRIASGSVTWNLQQAMCTEKFRSGSALVNDASLHGTVPKFAAELWVNLNQGIIEVEQALKFQPRSEDLSRHP